jgi:hypothetical protein
MLRLLAPTSVQVILHVLGLPCALLVGFLQQIVGLLLEGGAAHAPRGEVPLELAGRFVSTAQLFGAWAQLSVALNGS